jgi:hypothetical protein
MSLFLIKEIRSKEGELHFRRWRLLSTPWFSIYIHGIYKEDEDLHLHDHPWNYLSIILRGYFSEKTLDYDVITDAKSKEWKSRRIEEKVVGPSSFIKRKAETFHKIQKLHSKSVYTLFFVGKKFREWGYDVNGQWIDHVTYRKMKNEKQFN